MTSWFSPPTRRELTLLLFCVTIFILAYNTSASLRFPLIPFLSRPAPIGPDGRKQEGYRDTLENEIFGEWDWEPGHVAAVKDVESARVMHGKPYDTPDTYIRGEGLSGERAMWLQGVGEGLYAQGEGLGSTSVNDEFVRWGEDVPRTELRQHIPGASSILSVIQCTPLITRCDCPLLTGFTILDNVILLSGAFYIVTDDTTSMPPVEAIGSSMVNHNEASRAVDWQVFSAQAASSKFGPYGGRCAPIMTSENVYQLTFVFSCRHNSMHGVTFLSYDGPSATDSHTLLSLQRLYSTLNISSPQSLSPPHRVIFPAVRTFVDHSEDPLALDETAPRHLSSIGLAPETLKAAYPSLAGPLFTGDFDDFNELGPVVLDRLVVADRGAARRAGLAQDVPAWAPPFSALRTSEEWF